MLDHDIAANLGRVRERMARAAERAGRAPGDITLVAVSKTMDVETIIEAVADGVTHLGENRVQEASEKFALPGEGASSDKVGREGITLDMIGTLQRNKAHKAAALFDRVQSLDRIELAAALERAAGEEGKTLPVLLEVNLTGEASKSGVSPEGFAELCDALAGCPHLLGSGLMTVARMGADERELRETFGRLRGMLPDAAARCPGEWRDLSMGMTGDFEIAIEEGATIVRIGRAIFGERDYTRKTG